MIEHDDFSGNSDGVADDGLLSFEELREFTAKWSPVNRGIARLALRHPYEERRQGGGNLFEMRDKFDPTEQGLAEFIATTWGLPDDILRTIVASFPEDDESLLISK